MNSMRSRLAVVESMLQDQMNKNRTTATETVDAIDINTSDGGLHGDLLQRQPGSQTPGRRESYSTNDNQTRHPPPPSVEERFSPSKAATEHGALLPNTARIHSRRADSFNASDRGSRSTIDSSDSETDGVAEDLLDLVPATMKEHLLHLFWTRYSSTFPFIDKELFLNAKNQQNSSYYSKALEMCMLMTGLRFSSTAVLDLQHPMLTSKFRARRLHRATKRVLGKELERRTELPIIQSLILMAEAESNHGCHNTGCMYLGMAFRLALRIGLDRDSTYVGLHAKEAAVRHWTLYTCLMFERFWPLVFMRSSRVIDFDVQLLDCAVKSVEMSHHRLQAPAALVQQYTSLSLSDLSVTTRALQGLGIHGGSSGHPNDYFAAIAVGAELQALHNRLPEKTKWSPANAQTAKSFYFLFHQHYYVALILLHWPFAHFRPFSLRDGYPADEPAFQPQTDPPDQMRQVSRMICFTHAMTLTNMCKQHHARHNAREMVFVAVGHAEVAATALLMCLTHTQDPKKRDTAKAHLLDVIDVFKALAQTYDLARQLLGSLERSLSRWHQESALAGGSSFPGMAPSQCQIHPVSSRSYSNTALGQQLVLDDYHATSCHPPALDLAPSRPSSEANNPLPDLEWTKQSTGRSPRDDAVDDANMLDTCLRPGQPTSLTNGPPRVVGSDPEEPPQSVAGNEMWAADPISLCLTPSSRVGSLKDWPLYLSPNYSLYGETTIPLDSETFFNF
ncbi:hypothetical protein LTS17_001836 [Exophiala oligosperma]